MAICEKNLIADGTQSNQGHFLELIDGFFFLCFLSDKDYNRYNEIKNGATSLVNNNVQ
jgi:hypothetical protein